MDEIVLLKKLGMTEYEARAYLALARLGPSTVKEIVLNSKLPRNKAYEALQRLEEKHKIARIPVSPRKYKINNPEILADDVHEMQDSVADLVKLIHQPKSTEFKELFWIIQGQKAITQKLAIENGKAKKEVLACSRLPRTPAKNMIALRNARKRKVKIKMICTFNEKSIDTYKSWLKEGAQLRVFNEKKLGPLLPRITIFDGTKARLTIGKPEVKKAENYITFWTESKAFATMLRNQFLSMWNDCIPIEKFLNNKL